jgi:hypothetical protein
VRRRKEVTTITIAKAYLCWSVLVQNSLLELCAFQQGYVASVVPPEVPEKGRCRRSQVERLWELALRPSWCAILRPLVKHRGSTLLILPPLDTRLPVGDHGGATCQRPEKMAPSHDR